MENEIKEQNYKVIIKPAIARKLIKLGNVVCDIKPNKLNREASVFVFFSTDKLKNDLSKIIMKE